MPLEDKEEVKRGVVTLQNIAKWVGVEGGGGLSVGGGVEGGGGGEIECGWER